MTPTHDITPEHNTLPQVTAQHLSSVIRTSLSFKKSPFSNSDAHETKGVLWFVLYGCVCVCVLCILGSEEGFKVYYSCLGFWSCGGRVLELFNHTHTHSHSDIHFFLCMLILNMLVVKSMSDAIDKISPKACMCVFVFC